MADQHAEILEGGTTSAGLANLHPQYMEIRRFIFPLDGLEFNV
jgi:hypothetical protein